jgi:hypothetical protein
MNFSLSSLQLVATCEPLSRWPVAVRHKTQTLTPPPPTPPSASCVLHLTCHAVKTHSDRGVVVSHTHFSVVLMTYGPGQRLATGWTVRGSNSSGGEICHSRPDRSWGPPSLLNSGYRVSFPGVKRLRRGINHPPLSNPEVKERAELYLLPLLGLHGLL